MATKPTSGSTGSATGPQIKHDQIADRARRLWMERGSPGGRDLEHWLDAERQLREEMAGRPPAGASGKTPSDVDEAEKRLDGLIENKPSPARRTPDGEQL